MSQKFMSKFKDLTGQRFRRLLVLERAPNRGKYTCWRCRCDCGAEALVTSNELKRQHSCGCARRETGAKLRKPPGHSARNTIFRGYQANAARGGRVFELSLEQFHELAIQNCHYCGLEPSNVCQPRHPEHTPEWQELNKFVYTGIDRKDNNLGYVLSNCVPACEMCNFAKRDIPYEEFMGWIARFKRS